MKAFQALVTESDRVGMPLSFADDLRIHDQNRLADNDAPDRFGWVLRESGTLLLDARMQNTSRASYLAHITESGRCASDRCYFWDGSSLHSVTPEEMCLRMAPFSEQLDAHARY